MHWHRSRECPAGKANLLQQSQPDLFRNPFSPCLPISLGQIKLIPGGDQYAESVMSGTEPAQAENKDHKRVWIHGVTDGPRKPTRHNLNGEDGKTPPCQISVTCPCSDPRSWSERGYLCVCSVVVTVDLMHVSSPEVLPCFPPFPSPPASHPLPGAPQL